MHPQSHRTMKLRNGWVLTVLGALVFCTLLANGQRHERANPTDGGSKPSRGSLRFTPVNEDGQWDPERTDEKPLKPHVARQATAKYNVAQNSSENIRKSNYRTESRQEQEKESVRTIPKRTSDATSNQDKRNNRRPESPPLVGLERTERKHSLPRPAVVPELNLNPTPALPHATKQKKKGRVPEIPKSDDTARPITVNRPQRNQSRRGGSSKLIEVTSEKKTPSNNRRMDFQHTFDAEATDHRETLIDQEDIGDLKSNPSSTFPRPTRESRTSKRENISPDDNDISKTSRSSRNDRYGARSNSQSSTNTAELPDSRGRRTKSFEPRAKEESADIRLSKRKQTARSRDSFDSTTPSSPKPTRDTQTISRGRSHYSPEANEEAEPIKSRSRSGETVRSSRLQSRNRKPEDETSTVGRGRQYSRREPSSSTEETSFRSRTESGGRRGSTENRRDAFRGRNSPSRDDADESRSRKEKPADGSRESRQRRPTLTLANERKLPLKQVDVQEDSPKRRDPARSRGLAGRLPAKKPKKSLDFEINDDDNYPQEFIEKIRQTSSEVQSPPSSSTEDVVDVEEAVVANNSPATPSPEVSSTESTRTTARTNAFRLKPSSFSRNVNNVTPGPVTTLPSVPRVAANSRLQSLLKSRARPDTEATRPRLPKLKTTLEVENVIAPEEVSSVEVQLPETSHDSEPLLTKRPGFRPRQPYVPKPRTLDTIPAVSPRTPRPTPFTSSRTSSESGRQRSPLAPTRLRTVTTASAEAPLLRSLQIPGISSKLRTINLAKPQKEENPIDQVVVDEGVEETETKPSFRPKIPSIRNSEETTETVSKFKPKAKDLSVPRYTSGFRRNLPGTTSFETRNEVRTTTQLAASGAVPKHRFSSRYRSDLAKTAGRSATPAYVATVPSIASTPSQSSTVDYTFQDTGPRPRKRTREEMMHSPWANQY